MGEGQGHLTRPSWSTRKKDRAPRGVYRHRSGVWAIRFRCGAGCTHKERVGPLKSDAVRLYHGRRSRALDKPGWCPRIERRHAQERAKADQRKEASRITFGQFAEAYLAWSKASKRSWATDKGMVRKRVRAAFGARMLDDITAADIERFRDGLGGKVAPATVNRYTALLSGMFRRAIKLGHITASPVKGICRAKEVGQRIAWLAKDEEEAIHDALPVPLRPLFVVSVNTGLRWSEQIGLRWREIDMLAGVITIGQSKNGHARSLPFNSVVRSVLVDLASRRHNPSDADELVFACPHKQADKFFPKAIARAESALSEGGKDASRLDGYTWHGNRHTFASRLVMAGVDLRTVQELGGWKTLGMVQRYAHLAPEHLAEAVERLVPAGLHPTPREREDAVAQLGACR